MPPTLVDSVSDEVDDLSPSEAEDIWDEVKKSLRRDGEIPDENDDMSEDDWGLVVDAFLTTISARFDVNKSDLTEAKVKGFLNNRLDFDTLLDFDT